MNKIKLVAILRGIQPTEAEDHIETLINTGFRYIEPAQFVGFAINT